MANVYTSNPIELTGTVASYKAAVASTLGKLFTLVVREVYWLNPANVGDTITVTDPVSGTVLLELRCEVANQSQRIDWGANPHIWTDFSIASFPSGTLFIYTK